MTTPDAIMALKSAVGLVLLWMFVFILWKDYCLDEFRQSLFALRDELFLDAARGDLSFDEPAYRLLRERFNVTIRYAHEYTLSKLAIFTFHHVSRNRRDDQLGAAINSLPENKQRILQRYRAMFVVNVVRYVVLRSFVLSLFVYSSRFGFRLVQEGRKKILSRATPAVEAIELEVDEENRYDSQPMSAA